MHIFDTPISTSIAQQAIWKVKRLDQTRVVNVYDYQVENSFDCCQIAINPSKAIPGMVTELNPEIFAVEIHDNNNIKLQVKPIQSGQDYIMPDRRIKDRKETFCLFRLSRMPNSENLKWFLFNLSNHLNSLNCALAYTYTCDISSHVLEQLAFDYKDLKLPLHFICNSVYIFQSIRQFGPSVNISTPALALTIVPTLMLFVLRSSQWTIQISQESPPIFLWIRNQVQRLPMDSIYCSRYPGLVCLHLRTFAAAVYSLKKNLILLGSF